MTSRTARVLGLVARVLPLAVVGYTVFLLIRAHLMDRYLVPSRSMEPTLFGDPETGDLVLVDKTAWWRHEPLPLDLVVVRNAGDDRKGHLVKRMVWKNHGFVAIREGDLYTGSEAHALQRLQKDPVTHRSLRVTWYRWPDRRSEPLERVFRVRESGASLENGALVLPAGAASLEALAREMEPGRRLGRLRQVPPDPYLPGHLATRGAVDTSFLDQEWRRHFVARAFDRDLGLAFECVPQRGCVGLSLVLEHQGVAYGFAYEAGGTVQRIEAGATIGTAMRLPPLRAGQPVRVAFGHLDGRLFVTVGDRHDAKVLVDAEVPSRHEGEGPRPPFENLLHLGAAGNAGSGIELRALEVFHDLYYKSDAGPYGRGAAPYEVGDGEMFLLGDNTFDSTDSRMRVSGQFLLRDLVGRPLAVIAPLRRARWLAR
jgi:signal peptidase I